MTTPALDPGPEIVAEGLVRVFGSRRVLDGVNLTIATGEIVAIVGSSGCGKTVLLDHLTGLMAPDEGRVRVRDHDAPDRALVDLATLDDQALDRIRLHWQIVFQRNALFSGDVYENIALWLREHTELSPRAIDERVRASLAAVALDVGDVLHKDRDELSGGMAKRVAIARAIAARPSVLFYDEPTTGLDPVVSGHIHELIFSTHHGHDGPSDGPRTTIIVTHDKELLRRIQPRILMLDRGAVCFSGTYAEFTNTAQPIAQLYLRAMPVLHAREPA